MRLYLLASLLVLPACPLLDVTAQVQEVCMTYSGVTIPGVPIGQTSIEQSFTLDQLQGGRELLAELEGRVAEHLHLRCRSPPAIDPRAASCQRTPKCAEGRPVGGRGCETI